MKKLLVIVIAVCTGILLTGCALFSDQASSTPSQSAIVGASGAVTLQQATPSPSISTTPSPTLSASPTPSISGDPVVYQDNQINFEYYDVAQDKNVDVTVNVNEGASSAAALDAVNTEYIQKVIGADSIQTNSIVFTDGNIYIDFTDSIYDLNLGSGGEAGVLDSIANAYLNNVEGVKAVYFSVNGQNYSTGHIEINKDKPYKSIL